MEDVCLLVFMSFVGYQNKDSSYLYSTLPDSFLLLIGSVYCAVRTEYFNIIQVSFRLGRFISAWL